MDNYFKKDVLSSVNGLSQRLNGRAISKRAAQELHIRMSVSDDFFTVFNTYLKDIAEILMSNNKIHVKDKALEASKHMLNGEITAFIDLLVIHSYVHEATRTSNDIEDWGELYLRSLLDSAKKYNLSEKFLMSEHLWETQKLNLLRAEFNKRVGQRYGI